MKNIIFHAGVHKTGSTFIQNVLRENEDFLASNRIACRVGGEVWDELTSPIIYNAAGIRRLSEPYQKDFYKKELKDKVENWLGCHDTLIISNENLFGNSSVKANQGKLYPRAKDVVEFLLDALADDYNVKMVFLVRDYADFLDSTYAQKIKEGQSFSFDDFISKVDFEEVSWIPLVSGVTQTCRRYHCLVEWQEYEEFCRDQFSFVKRTLIGFDGASKLYDDFKMDPEIRSNSSYSFRAVKLASILNQHLEKSEIGVFRNFLKDKFPPSEYGKPRFIDGVLRKKLAEKYLSDIERLRESS